MKYDYEEINNFLLNYEKDVKEIEELIGNAEPAMGNPDFKEFEAKHLLPLPLYQPLGNTNSTAYIVPRSKIASKTFGISEPTWFRWLKKYDAGQGSGLEAEVSILKAEVRRLLEENRELNRTVERLVYDKMMKERD